VSASGAARSASFFAGQLAARPPRAGERAIDREREHDRRVARATSVSKLREDQPEINRPKNSVAPLFAIKVLHHGSDPVGALHQGSQRGKAEDCEQD
jgi:hypothetical protein